MRYVAVIWDLSYSVGSAIYWDRMLGLFKTTRVSSENELKTISILAVQKKENIIQYVCFARTSA